MRRALLTGYVVIAIALSAGGGFWLGLREGWELALMADSARIGFVAVPRLVAIESENVDVLNTALELDVDNGLIWAHYFFESPLHPYLAGIWGLNGYPENRKEMARLASYRRAHPPRPFAGDGTDGVSGRQSTQHNSGDGITDASLERRRIIDDMVRRFAPKP